MNKYNCMIKIEIIDQESSMYVLQDIKFLISDLKVNSENFNINIVDEDLLLIGFKIDDVSDRHSIFNIILKMVINLKRTFNNSGQSLVYYDNGFSLYLPYVCNMTMVTSI